MDNNHVNHIVSVGQYFFVKCVSLTVNFAQLQTSSKISKQQVIVFVKHLPLDLG
jgi:hypothetical protein